MKKLINLLVFVILTLTLINTNVFSYNAEPKIFITELLNDAVKTLNDKNISKIDKTKKIENIAKENVDIKALGMYTLGSVRKTLDEDTLKKYEKLFEKYFLKSLTSRLNDYSKQKFEVLSADQKSETYTIVDSKIMESSSQPDIKISWRVYTKDPAKPLIRDLIVEGLSLAKTQKEEFASILNSNNNDINILFSKLQEFINK
jgi:phospholipid transport system substrate-binding protein|tara:strand:- start:76 stop:681 length:606 start_codon:yes stop_codon:yes gene_type:complete